jgi:hypothetical protein
MKMRFWDIVAIIGLIALCIIAVVVITIFINPQTKLNPFPPATLPPIVVIPSSTATSPRLPSTWTPTVALTLEVGMQPSSTLPPTATGFSLPTFTATATFTPTATNTPVMTATYTQAPNQALWISQIPPDGTAFTPKQEFDMIWKIRNTGILTWNKNYTYRYLSGEPIHEKASYNVKGSIASGQVAELIVDMRAPEKTGTYATVWRLYDDGGVGFYSFNFYFVVR